MATKKPTQTKTADKPETAKEAPTPNLPATISLRLPYPGSLQEYAGIDKRGWQVLIDVIFPNATTAASIVLAVQYCVSRRLDIFKKVIHIVPMRRKTGKKDNSGKDTYEMVDTIWPGIAEVRITATRTLVYAGKDAAVFGPMKKRTFQNIDTRNGEIRDSFDMEFPEWCQLTVYKIVQGQRCAFVGPKVFWEEAYATESFFSDIPNEMWKARDHGQLEKCTEAAALRSAFPEELGGEYTAEEMHGRTLDTTQVAAGHYATSSDPEVMTPPRPRESDFRRPEAVVEAKSAVVEDGKPSEVQEGDGRPEPPPVGEAVERQPVAVQAAMKPELVREAEEPEPGPSPAWIDAEKMLAGLGENMGDVGDLDGFKKAGRTNIDALEGLTADERDVLRGRFTSMVLIETQRRAKKRK